MKKPHQAAQSGIELAQAIDRAPRLVNARKARALVAEFVTESEDDTLAQMASTVAVRDLLAGLADHSPYLWRLAKMDAVRLVRLLDAPPEIRLAECLSTAVAVCREAQSDDVVMEALRRAKQEASLLIALADIGGVWTLLQVTHALASFADCVVQCALSYLLRKAADAGRLNIPDLANPQEHCGIVVLAMGKHGARELNYSSDIDLIVFFDPESPAIPEGVNPGPLFVQITQRLARFLEDRTGDGYVLRVDLRLRPDPGSTSVAISLPAAANYYETLGQNWERAAMIKARAIAGEIPLGESFMAELAPFIWRKYFDYAAIADVHAMKRQIHSVRGHAEVAIAGHDLKLGRGGIREIEFFVQTQQLIFGGRRPHLRGSRTLDMLVELQRDGWVTEDAVRELTAAYIHLRTLEHRLQMIADEQTQRLPADPVELASFAKFCGHTRLASFEKELLHHLRNVEKHYSRLFEHAAGLDAEKGSLVFTGVADDPETLETLKQLGFTDAPAAAEIVRGWHFGRRAAVQSARAREVLTELIPALLESFSGSGDPDAALLAFDAALTRMPAAIELLSILKSNKSIRDLFADILGSAPRLAQIIAQRPHVLDAAIDPALVQSRGDDANYRARIAHALRSIASTEDFLDAMRDLVQEETFLIGVRALSDIIGPIDAGHSFSALAGAVIEATYAWTVRTFADEYGRVPGGRCVVLGLGKLGSREMTAASDLDLIIIYDFDPEHPESSGPKSLHGAQYYARLTQRIISALTVATRRGRLYDVDMRLRPSGQKGPLATQFRSFVDYQTKEAETWEHMALTRARLMAGDIGLADDVEACIRGVLIQPREEEVLRREVWDMRRLIAQEKGESDIWDLKLAAGGIIDIEFIAQYLSLRHGAKHPEMIDVETGVVLEKVRAVDKSLASKCDQLLAAHQLYGAFTQITRMSVDGPFDPKSAPVGVKRRIDTALNLPDFRRVEQALAESRQQVRSIFDELLSSSRK